LNDHWFGFHEVGLLIHCLSLKTWLIVLMLTLICTPLALALPNQVHDVGFGVALSPSSIVLKVGDTGAINVTVTNPDKVNGTQVCFTLGGFPSTGFRTSFAPQCSSLQNGGFATVLTIVVTPASAPQTVQGIVTASSGEQSAQATLNLTVEPAMAAWIPWLGLILFFVILTVAVLWKPKMPGKARRRKSKKQQER
jgi:hypothetical protein